MRVSAQQWEQAQSIVRQLSRDEKLAFSGIRPREIRWLVEPLDAKRSPWRDQIIFTRNILERLFSEHGVQDDLSRNLLARLLVLGDTQIFQRLKSIKDPVEIAQQQIQNPYPLPIPDKYPDEDPQFHTASLLTELSPEDSIPSPDRASVNRIGNIDSLQFLKFVVPVWNRPRVFHVIQKYRPFSDELPIVRQELLEEAPDRWKWMRTDDDRAAAARANRKTKNHLLCEDGTVVYHINGSSERNYWIAGAMDGVSLGPKRKESDNMCKWLFSKLLSFHIAQAFRGLVSASEPFPSANEVFEAVVEAVVIAQVSMQNLLQEITPCLYFNPKREARSSSLAQAMSNNNSGILDAMRQDYLYRYAGSTTLEMILVSPEHGRGIQLKVGDGQTLKISSSGTVQTVGPNNKRKDHRTSAIGVHDTQNKIHHSLSITPFAAQSGDTFLVTTDGLADNLSSVFLPEKITLWTHLKKFFLRNGDEGTLGRVLCAPSQASDTVSKICDLIDFSSLDKPDDFGFAVIKT